jgi:hypothetical protein
MDVKGYAESVGRKQQSVSNEVCAARVAEAVPDIRDELSCYFSQLVAIHARTVLAVAFSRLGVAEEALDGTAGANPDHTGAGPTGRPLGQNRANPIPSVSASFRIPPFVRRTVKNRR